MKVIFVSQVDLLGIGNSFKRARPCVEEDEKEDYKASNESSGK
jgi:hypothetical protein